MTLHRMTRIVGMALILASLSMSLSCGGDNDKGMSGPSSSCTMGPYTFDSNPNVNRCRASNGQFAANVCCGR